MTGTPAAVTVSLLTRMLREAFEGPPGPWTYFTDTSPGTGVFGTIDGLSAADASQEGGPGSTTIAGHVHHLTASVALSTKGLRGESTSRDRGGSWTVSTNLSDSYLDTVEFHPAYHECMDVSMREGLHCSAWDHLAKPGTEPLPGANVARSAGTYMAIQMEAGHQCPITMTNASVPTHVI